MKNGTTIWLFNSSPWNITIFNSKTIYKGAIFHGYVKYPDGKTH